MSANTTFCNPIINNFAHVDFSMIQLVHDHWHHGITLYMLALRQYCTRRQHMAEAFGVSLTRKLRASRHSSMNGSGQLCRNSTVVPNEENLVMRPLQKLERNARDDHLKLGCSSLVLGRVTGSSVTDCVRDFECCTLRKICR